MTQNISVKIIKSLYFWMHADYPSTDISFSNA